jgi:hypothetical protein
VDQAHGVVGEVGCFDDPGPPADEQVSGDVLAVLLVLITAGGVDGVGDRGDQVGGTVAELPGQRREGGLPGAAGRDVFRMVFDGVVEQRGACYVGSVTR